MNRQLFEYHPTVGYKFIPNLKARIQHEAGGYLLRTNPTGFRSEIDFNNQKVPDKKKILVFGDSFTAGDGVSNKYRFTDLLNGMLPQTDIYNFGLSGSGTDQQYLLYKDFGHAMDYDLLVIVVLVENIRRVKSHYRYYYNDQGEKMVYQKPFFELNGKGLNLLNVPVNPNPIRMEDLPIEEQQKVDKGGKFELARNVVNALGLKQVAQKFTKYQPVPEYGKANTPEWLTMKTILLEWIRMAKSRVVLVPFPLYQHIEETSSAADYQKRFAELASEANCELIDPLPALQNYSMEERRNFRFKTDVHPTPLCHKAVAEILHTKISTLV
ncbi:MAG TPA: SGNH/GDSL hydrolase family protein [Cyclobacteriaceae bacterium]